MNEFNDSHINLNDKSVLVTGGTGSFGNEFIKIVLDRYKPKKLIIFSRDEMKQYEMAQIYSDTVFPCLRYFIGDVRDADRLEMAMRDVDYVIHAAALKHVPTAEYNPFECVNTNIYGAENIVKAALRTGVKKVLALSTDKAANPINLYGASKLASDKIFTAANNLSGVEGASFSIVRYGNVIGSRGSVISLYKKLVNDNAKSLPITDERMTRFWITLSQGVNFVLSCMKMMQGGEIFVPKIPSMKITEVAKIIAPNIDYEIIGIRPGEKIHEVMITENDSNNTVELSDRYIVQPGLNFWKKNSNVSENKVAMNFSYTSDNNDDWLDKDGLLTMLKDSG